MSNNLLLTFIFHIHHSGFMAVCPDGVLTRENIVDMYDMPKHRAKIFIDQIFKLFDKDGVGVIKFRVRNISNLQKKNY